MHEHVEHRLLDRVGVQPLRHRQVALRVEVDQQHAMAVLGERDAEVERRRRLRDAALLVREDDHLRVGRGRLARRANVGTRKEARETHVTRHFASVYRIPSASSRSFARPPARGRRPRPAPTPRPRGRAPATRPATTPRLRRARPAPRSARAAPKHRVRLRPCIDRSRSDVTCLCRLRAESVTQTRQATRSTDRPRPQAEQRLVERRRRARRGPRAEASRRARGEPRRGRRGRGARRAAPRASSLRSCRLLGEQHRSAHRRRPGAAVAAEQADERLAHLGGAERLVGEERELPAVERLAELTVVVGERSRSRRSAASRARTVSRRVGSPRGCVAAIGSSGATRSGRKSSRSNTTGPAAIAPGGREPQRVTASASSAAASGGSDSSGSSSRASSSTSSRSTSRPNCGGISPSASGQSCEISPATIGRTVMSPPRSASLPADRPTSGASAT